METIQYKGYFIKPSEWLSGKYEFSKEEGDTSTVAESIEDAKDMITEILMTAQPEWRVQSKSGKIETFEWLFRAVEAAEACGGKVLYGFNSI
jgi:hypothetical protein